MKRKGKHTSRLYQFLERKGVLTNGTDADIASAKQQYWKEYKAAWRKRQRQETREFTIVCTPKEAKVIIDAARRHKRSLQAFVKDATLGYVSRRYIVPDVLAISTIQQQLAVNYNALQLMFDESIVPYQLGKSLMQQISALEQTVLEQLRSPKTLEQWIADTVHGSPEYRDLLIMLLQNL
ncbi:MAG: hypothetical protein JWQ38_342 [Flavipsychrobacter sp.]|nr:hypothetical protein [Flavipsychrobacter sp.]